MAADVEDPVEPDSTVANVESWRYDQLCRSGYPSDVACHLAERPDIDLHQACDLLDRYGASVNEALAILM